MYVGHLAVALSAVRLKRDAPLWMLLLAAQGPDWIQLGLEVLGSDRAQLYSHSMPAVFVAALAFALACLWQTGSSRTAVLIAAVYASHLVLDLVTGTKPLWPGGHAIGANLYNRPALDFVLEASLVVIGWLLYHGTVRARRWTRPAFAILATLIACQAMLDVGQGLRLIRNERNARLKAQEEAEQAHTQPKGM